MIGQRFGLLLLVCLLLVGGLLLLPRVRPVESTPLTVAAASDLTVAFTEIGLAFTESTGVEVDFTFGSSGQLAQQIAAGAPVDVYAAANRSFVDDLAVDGTLIPESIAEYARGHLVMWTRSDSRVSITEIGEILAPNIGRIAIANPNVAPYGVAAREALQAAGIWDALQDRLVIAENVRDALRYAETGDADVALVSLALVINGDGVITDVPADHYSPLRQTLAVVASTRQWEAAHAFAGFVLSPEGQAILARYGFDVGQADGTEAATNREAST